MRKLYILLIGLLLLIGCGAPEQDMAAITIEVDGSESRGAEQAARATPLPPRDKATPLALSNAVTISNALTVTQAVTITEPLSTTVRGEATETVIEAPSKRIHCLPAEHATHNGD